jgi:hypothetical protein
MSRGAMLDAGVSAYCGHASLTWFLKMLAAEQSHCFHRPRHTEQVDNSLEVVGEDMQAYLSANMYQPAHQECVEPIQCFSVPNTCSIVRRRSVIACGFRSSRRCIAS